MRLPLDSEAQKGVSVEKTGIFFLSRKGRPSEEG